MKKQFSLRVSVTPRCQLSCLYCLPEKIKNDSKKFLSLSDYEKIISRLKTFFIKKIRFTGGEPLLRKDLYEVVSLFKNNFLQSEVALTTNGLLYERFAKKLSQSGLSQITFHLDTLNASKFKEIMGQGDINAVFSSIDLAKQLGHHVKINMVVQKNINEDELFEFLFWSKRNDVEVRFIEQMNTGSAIEHVNKTFLSGQNILEQLKSFFTIEEVARDSIDAPAEKFLVKELDLIFGLIASDTRPFCQNCNRLRLSATGFLRTCLYEPVGRPLLNRNAQQGISAQALENSLAKKISYHPLIGQGKKVNFSMSEVGG